MSTELSKALPLGHLVGDGVRALRAEQGLTQDGLARRLRDVGGDWDQGAIARLESGRRGVSLEQLPLLALVLGVPVHRVIGGADDDWVMLSPRTQWTVRALRATYAGQNPADISAAEFDDPGMKALATGLGRRREHRESAIRVWPGATAADISRAIDDIGDAERKAGRHFGVDPAAVSAAAHRTWGHALAAERDARAELLTVDEAGRRSLQALRGHVTRQLLSELAPILNEEQP